MADEDMSELPGPDRERLKMDYEQTMAAWRMLVDLRFRLLAFVPSITGVVVALAGRSPSATSALVAALSLTALFGIIIYDLRNTQFHDAAIHRAKALERSLGLARLSDKGTGGGLMSERPRERYRLAGVQVWHDRGLFIVYSASAAGLAAIGLLGVLASLKASAGWRLFGATALGIAVFVTAFHLLHRFDMQIRKPQPVQHPSAESDVPYPGDRGTET
jgi:hypothetical protein